MLIKGINKYFKTEVLTILFLCFGGESRLEDKQKVWKIGEIKEILEML